MTVCKACGVPLAHSERLGRWLHTDSIPPGVDPAHEPEPVEEAEFEATERDRQDLHTLAAELIAHHTVMHPMSECPFATKLAQALRAKR